jgi:uncharacterized protein (DUF952 family)
MHRSARAALEIGRFPRYTCEVSHPLPGPRGATPEPPAALYKVCPRSSWSEALSLGALPPSAADARDGYVHLSAAHQVRATLERHFARQPDLVLLALLPERMPGHALRWEAARNGELFPHLYGELRAELVHEVYELPLNGAEQHVLPQTIAGSPRNPGS